jgi:hypothetical protein
VPEFLTGSQSLRRYPTNPQYSTYYYAVDSMQGNGKSDGVKSAVNHFTSP